MWADMRGAVGPAAAQTLPADAPARPLLVLVAFAVAAGSLLLRAVVADRAVPADRSDAMRAQLRLIAAQRDLLLRVHDDGRFSTTALEAAPAGPGLLSGVR